MSSVASPQPAGTILKQKVTKRVNKAHVLEQQAVVLAEQAMALAKENARLHAKQAMQLEVLANYEDSLHHMGVLLCQVQNAKDASFLSAAMLDLHAGALLQQLSTHSSTAAGLSHSGTSAPAGDGPWSLMTDSGGVDASTAAVPASAAVSSHASWSELFRSYSHMHSSGGVVGVGGTAGTGGDSSSGKPVTGARWRSRTQRMWASITPEAVLDMKGITVTGLAERFKSAAARMALLARCNRGNTLSCGLGAAVDDYGVTAILAMLAADEQFLEFTCMNLETMRPQAPSEDIYPFIIRKAALTEQQRLQAFLAFNLYRDHRAALLQEQAETIVALQALLGGQQQPQPLPGTEAHAGAPALQQDQHATSADTDAPDVRVQHVQEQQDQHACSEAARAADTVPAAPDGAAPEAGLQPCTEVQHPTVVSGSSRKPAGSTEGAGASTLDFESAERAEQLLLRLQRNIRLQREFSKRLVFLWMDLLTTSQHVDAILAAYPFTIKIPAVFAQIWQQECKRQGSEGQQTGPKAHA